MEVAPFFVDFHHILSIFTIFCRFSPFFIDFHDLRTFVAIYILSQLTHFFRKFLLAKIAFSATSHVFCMYDGLGHRTYSTWRKICEFWIQRRHLLSVKIALNCEAYLNFTEADNMAHLMIELSLRFSQHNMLHKRCLTAQSGWKMPRSGSKAASTVAFPRVNI